MEPKGEIAIKGDLRGNGDIVMNPEMQLTHLDLEACLRGGVKTILVGPQPDHPTVEGVEVTVVKHAEEVIEVLKSLGYRRVCLAGARSYHLP